MSRTSASIDRRCSAARFRNRSWTSCGRLRMVRVAMTAMLALIAMQSMAAPFLHFPGDDHLLDLTGALVDAEDAHVAVEALDAVVGDVAGAAEDLHRLVGDA